LVTLSEPTADQRLAVKRYKKTTQIVSFDELRSLLFDAHSYLRIRSNKPFGSVYDHASHTFEVPRNEFVEPTITAANSGEQKRLSDIAIASIERSRTIITAEYGIGKSMLLRELFFSHLNAFTTNQTFRCPVAINLREHIGQEDP